MKTKVKKAIEEYQCPGCMVGGDVSCFEKRDSGVGCSKHYAGTNILPYVGTIFLGMPKGFNRLGEQKDLKPYIYESFDESDWGYDTFNIPCWKHLSKEGHTFVRGISPRINTPFVHVFLEDCMDRIDCLEITEDIQDKMD